MSGFTTLRDKVEHMLAVLFGIVKPIGEHVLKQTGQDVAAAVLAGTVHGSDDMINVVKTSLIPQLPEIRNEAITAVAALVAHHEAEAAQPKEGT